MNSRTLIAIVAVLILLNVGAWYFLKGRIQPQSPQLSQFQTSNPKTLTYPTEPYQTGIEDVKLVYVFSGKISAVETAGDNQRNIKLENSPTDSPEFKTNIRTNVVRVSGEKVSQGKVEDLQIGQLVSLSMTYNIKTQVWQLEVITIRE